eukprot:scaffold461_cov321-Pavlova_lutheri.AAC.30
MHTIHPRNFACHMSPILKCMRTRDHERLIPKTRWKHVEGKWERPGGVGRMRTGKTGQVS